MTHSFGSGLRPKSSIFAKFYNFAKRNGLRTVKIAWQAVVAVAYTIHGATMMIAALTGASEPMLAVVGYYGVRHGARWFFDSIEAAIPGTQRQFAVVSRRKIRQLHRNIRKTFSF